MNNIEEIIKSMESEGFRFNPTADFYKKIGIRQKRFGQLKRNERSPTLDELRAIAAYFNVPISKIIKQ